MSNMVDAPTSKKPNSFQYVLCSLCERIQIHYKGSCTGHSTFPKPASLGGMVQVEDRIKPTRIDKSSILYQPATPEYTKGKLNPDDILCCGCDTPISKAFHLPGKAWKATSFLKQTKTELVWDPKSGETRIDEISKGHAIPSYRKGILCASCCADYSVIEHTDKLGVTTWIPRVVLDKSVTEHDTLGSAKVQAATVHTKPAAQYKEFLVSNGLAPTPVELPSYAPKTKGRW